MGRWYGEAHGVEELDGQIITKIHKVVLSKDWEEFYEQMIIEIWGEWTRFKKEKKKRYTLPPSADFRESDCSDPVAKNPLDLISGPGGAEYTRQVYKPNFAPALSWNSDPSRM